MWTAPTTTRSTSTRGTTQAWAGEEEEEPGGVGESGVGAGHTPRSQKSARDASVSVGLDVSVCDASPDIGIFKSVSDASVQYRSHRSSEYNLEFHESRSATPMTNYLLRGRRILALLSNLGAAANVESAQSQGSQNQNPDQDSIALHAIRSVRSQGAEGGNGHRRCISQARQSRSLVYETIEEEMPSPGPESTVECGTTRGGLWRQDGIMSSETRRSIRIDTAFSVYALQTFQPPRDPIGIQVLLQHSIQNYGPLPSELRARRDRTSSRPSPYPQSQQSHYPYSQQGSHYSQQARKFSTSPETKFSSSPEQARAPELPCTFTPALQEVKSATPSVIKTFPVDDSELKKEKENNTAAIRPRVGSTAYRTALG
ncbi:hypothetical protein C8J56DRAFT_892127 [Mycena floridula]|nr:hypothetical protein C8J56DRAFT_892127 [Mycena floridula]